MKVNEKGMFIKSNFTQWTFHYIKFKFDNISDQKQKKTFFCFFSPFFSSFFLRSCCSTLSKALPLSHTRVKYFVHLFHGQNFIKKVFKKKAQYFFSGQYEFLFSYPFSWLFISLGSSKKKKSTITQK